MLDFVPFVFYTGVNLNAFDRNTTIYGCHHTERSTLSFMLATMLYWKSSYHGNMQWRSKHAWIEECNESVWASTHQQEL